MNNPSPKIRNIAIIAHVDHGKTTLVDGLLKQSHTFRDNQVEMNQSLIMDSMDQEKERGITITAKITSISYNQHRINIIDTPGHADFSGEVERIMNMADGVLLVVDAQEGPMPQTKFVLAQALAENLKVIVVINKIDKTGADVKRTEDQIADLFLELAVHEDQLHYPIYYGCLKDFKAWDKLPSSFTDEGNLEGLMEGIIDYIPEPKINNDPNFVMQVSALDFDQFKGKYVIGKILSGKVTPKMNVAINSENKVDYSKVEGVYLNHGLDRIEVNEAQAGDIASLIGFNAKIGQTITDSSNPKYLPARAVEKPTMSIYLGPNTSPFKAKEGKFVTSRQIENRLLAELETNVGLQVENTGIGFKVSGRGELHLGVLIEAMRREGFEFEVGRPEVITRIKDNVLMEPFEEVIIEVPDEYVGKVQTETAKRRALLKEQFVDDNRSITKLIYEMSTRAIIGLANNLLTATRGTVIINSIVIGYKPHQDNIKQIRNGVIVAYESGETTAYSLANAEQRGTLFVGPATKVYAGQIVGLLNKSGDLEINVCKAKHLTNMRSSSSDGTIQLTPPIIMSLEQCLDFLEEDELLEVTPASLRLRKRELDHLRRKRS